MEVTVEKELKSKQSTRQTSSSVPFQVFTAEDCREDMLYDYLHGSERGTTTYFKEFDQAWTWRRGEVILVTGLSGEGKSLFLKQMALIKYLAEGKKFIFCSPEDFPPKSFYDDMVHTLSGKSTDIGRLGAISREEYEKCVDRINEGMYFLHIKPPHNTITSVMEAAKMILDSDPDILGLIIDPIIKFSREVEAPVRDDLFAGYIMMNITEFTREANICTFIVMHQVTPKVNDKGLYDKPSPYMIKSGGSWSDSADCVLYIHRPFYAKDKLNPSVMVGSLKVKKQKLVGIPQDVLLSFDRKTNRYVYEGGKSVFDFDKYKMK